MTWHASLVVFIPLAVLILALLLFVRWGTRWGSTADERHREMAGDSWLDGGPRNRAVMTRAVSVEAPPEQVWPWLAQLGRGAGWYSYDRLDNGGIHSARHIVFWIPAPRLGDATAIGYLRHLESGRELVWWMSGERFLGMTVRMATSMRLEPDEVGSRLVVRISGDTPGIAARPLMLLFKLVDSIMARKQLLGIRRQVEGFGVRRSDPQSPETGERHQFQRHHVIYADGSEAGVAGREKASQWRQGAAADGFV